MTSITFFFFFIPLLAFILLAIDLIFAPHNPYQEKNSVFECGFHSFLGQNRTQFSISFFIFGLLFLLFDLEILLVYPFIVSAYINSLYGLIIMLLFFLLLTLGFAFELGKNALKIDSRQIYSVITKDTKIANALNSNIWGGFTTQHNTTQHNTTQHNTTQHNTTQHNTYKCCVVKPTWMKKMLRYSIMNYLLLTRMKTRMKIRIAIQPVVT